MKNIVIPALVAAALAAPLPALADDPVIVWRDNLAFAEGAPVDGDAWKRWAEDFSRDMRHSMSTMFAPRMGGKVVKGAPYSAEMVTESNQMLADGNVISHRKVGAVYRDGEGRTRQESGAEGKERSIFINDPVAGQNYVLSPGSKRAVARTAPRAVTSYKGDHKEVVRIGPSEIRVENGKVFIDGKHVTGSAKVEVSRDGKQIVIENGRITIDGKEVGRGPGPGRTVITSVEDNGDGTRREEVRVHVIRSSDGKEVTFTPPIPPVPPVPPVAPVAPVPPVPPIAFHMPGVNTMRFESTAKLGKGVTTNLGMKEFDGVKAEGKSTTWTIPAGEIGNKNPINVMSESWYSPDLQVTVYSRYSDPRTGESIYRLATIRRGEPSADLFKVPEDYQTKGRAPKG